jgi:hypothetical protein
MSNRKVKRIVTPKSGRIRRPLVVVLEPEAGVITIREKGTRIESGQVVLSIEGLFINGLVAKMRNR